MFMNSVERYFSSHSLSFFLILFLFFPYFTVMIFNGIYTALVNRAFDVEMVLPAVLATQIEEDYEARSNFYRKMKEESGLADLLDEVKTEFTDIASWKKLFSFRYEKAVTDTEGEVLVCRDVIEKMSGKSGEVQRLSLNTKAGIPYHKISAGKTRSGEEVFHDEAHSYLQSVESSQDKESEEYLTGIYINQNYLPEKLVIKERDSAGYVTELLADGKIVEGEAFRKGLGLVSANFTMQKFGDQVRFLCKGKGHGLGFSQYGGNEMAKEGKTEKEILEIYFPEMQVTDINKIQELLEKQ